MLHGSGPGAWRSQKYGANRGLSSTRVCEFYEGQSDEWARQCQKYRKS